MKPIFKRKYLPEPKEESKGAFWRDFFGLERGSKK
jgi:hypothetical protein